MGHGLVRHGHFEDGVSGSTHWQRLKIREWLLLLLRYAVTHEVADRKAAIRYAAELDSPGRWWTGGPGFFVSTTQEVCRAVVSPKNPYSDTVLRIHSSRIEDVRLRRAFRAAVGLERERAARPPKHL
jgi:hypothetical protein